MNTIRFAHRYFQFSWKNWVEYWGNATPTIADLKILFVEEPFPRRQLVIDSEMPYLKALDDFPKILERENQIGIRSVSPTDSDFPQQLLQSIAPDRLSPVYYLCGAPLPNEQECVAMVGTRNPSQLGIESAQNFAAFFSLRKIKIVSGLARGIDTIAHQENISVGTIAVLGGGLLDIYPRENLFLSEKILENGGTLLSEFPTDQITLPRNFPKRNETIAALAAGTVVVEGRETSGSYITGRHALSMGKHTAVLCQDYRTSAGRAAIQLIYDGAQPVCDEEEALHYIFSRFGGFTGSDAIRNELSKKERKSDAFLH